MAELVAFILNVFTPINLLAILAGVIAGLLIGGLPGLTANLGVALLLPVTFGMEVTPALLMLSSLYTAAIYGGSFAAILLHTPGTSASAAGLLPPAAPAEKRKQSALIEGEVRPFRGNYRKAIDTINSFADRIEKSPAVAEVRVVKLPLNVNPTLQLSGNTLDSPDQTATAEFKLLIVFKPNV